MLLRRDCYRNSLCHADVLKLNDDELAVLIDMFSLPGKMPGKIPRKISGQMDAAIDALVGRYSLRSLV